MLAYPVRIAYTLHNKSNHLNQGNCELYALTAVDADGVPTSGGNPDTNVTCNLIRSTSVPDSDTAILTSAGDLVSTNTPGASLRSVDLTILPRSGEFESSPRYHALCEISAPVAPTQVHASASLILDIDTIVIGFSKPWRFVPSARPDPESPRRWVPSEHITLLSMFLFSRRNHLRRTSSRLYNCPIPCRKRAD